MADNERNFSDAAQNASPDVTLKVTDEQLSQSATKAKEYLQNLQQGDFLDDDSLSDARASISTTSIGGFFNFLHRNLLPDLPDRDATEATILLDNTRNDLNIKLEEEVDTTLGDERKFPKLTDIYQVKEPFAGGGQGIISQALDKTLHRNIAIKSLRKEILDKPALRKAFINEAMITAQLEHPAIIPIHGLFSDDENGIHQAMKLVKGHTLKEELQSFIAMRKKDGTKISQGVMNRLFNERIDLLLRVCDAVAYAHSRNIIHCDLKPENIMIGEYGEIYVMDWGLARRFRDEKGNILPPAPDAPLDGTPRYMPAETFQGKPREERTDIFALGLILFEMVTLRHGYNGKTIQEVIQRIKNGQRNPVVNRFGYDLNQDLVAIIEKATAYFPDERYQHVNDLTEDLKRYLAGMAVSARPESLLEKFFRVVKRYSRTLVLLTLISWAISGIFIRYHLKSIVQQQDQELTLQIATNKASNEIIQAMGFEQKLADMDAKVIHSAIWLSNGLVNLACDLRNISLNAGLLLSSPNFDSNYALDDDTLPFIPYRQINGISSPAYNDNIQPQACSYQIPPGRNHDQIADELRRLRPIAPSLQNLVLSSTDLLRGSTSNDQMFALVQEGVLIRRVYLAMADTSLHLAYPGSSNYPDDYDNHTRPWYYSAKDQAHSFIQVQKTQPLGQSANIPMLKPIWGKPYLDSSNSDDNRRQQVLTCSIPIVSPDQKTFLGVAAFDLFFETFAEQLRISGNEPDDEIIEKYLCSATDGTILCYVPIHPLTEQAIPYADMEAALREQVKTHRVFSKDPEHTTGYYGHIRQMEKDERGHEVPIILHFAYIPGLNLYLIEKSREDKIHEKMEREQMDSLAIEANVPVPLEAPPPADMLTEEAAPSVPESEPDNSSSP